MVVDGYADAAVIGLGDNIYGVYLTGGVFLFFKTKKKSAEVILVVSNEPYLMEQYGSLTKQRRAEH